MCVEKKTSSSSYDDDDKSRVIKNNIYPYFLLFE